MFVLAEQLQYPHDEQQQLEYISKLQVALLPTEEDQKAFFSSAVGENGQVPEDLECSICNQVSFKP